eukprot:CAMPEP_0171937992 /NCGR_PEP_ID=MMETSP0993-20121228/35068_1 /TAXON_ID=483369 /ORGANISM="non described non described, Strain CCMP2098" /LENGTH=296 /DNA_ID=CAMNT_0012579455 /DNA_START=143 /DNA_END=1034 /DNA_ORIENTATION=+
MTEDPPEPPEIAAHFDLRKLSPYEGPLDEHFECAFMSGEVRTNPHHDVGDGLSDITAAWDRLNPPAPRSKSKKKKHKLQQAINGVSGRPPKKRLMVVLSGREGNRKSQGPKERQVAAGTIYVGGVLRQKSTGDKDMDYLASPVLALLWDFDGAPDPPAVDDDGGGGAVVHITLRHSAVDLLRRQLEYNAAKLTSECAEAMLAQASVGNAGRGVPGSGGTAGGRGWRASFLTCWETDPCSENAAACVAHRGRATKPAELAGERHIAALLARRRRGKGTRRNAADGLRHQAWQMGRRL